jgi:hypothetical protein
MRSERGLNAGDDWFSGEPLPTYVVLLAFALLVGGVLLALWLRVWSGQ